MRRTSPVACLFQQQQHQQLWRTFWLPSKLQDHRQRPLAHLRMDMASASDFHKNGGPLTHLVAAKKASAVSPREASSAGFNFVSTCLHCDGSEPSRIIAILFATNVRNLLSSFLMYFSTVVLLVQKCDVSMGSCSSFLISLSRLISTVAADNSSCGMEMLFKGTSLDLAIMKAQ